jgi:hypothetical protein
MRKAGMPLYQHRIAADWSGVIPGVVLSCPKHPIWFPANDLIRQSGTSLPRIPVSAEPMPCELLREAYERHLESGRLEPVDWLPRRGNADLMLDSG